MFSIVPIGTCRIHTPLRRAESAHAIDVRRARNYGFTHTADEALQQLLFMRQDRSLQPEVLPLLFRPGAEDRVDQQAFQEPDLYLIEISSSKVITIEDVALQINYLNRHFSDFFSDTTRARKFWQLAASGEDAARAEWLLGQPAFCRLSGKDQALLRKMRLRHQSVTELGVVMEQIIDATTRDKVVFVTHVNAMNPDGKRIASRDALISGVEANAGALGARVYNPTELMLAYEQSRAMEKGGLDLTHFTPAFADHLVTDWDRTFLGGSLIVEEARIDDDVLNDFASLLANDEIVPASRLLRAAARKADTKGPILRELARLEYLLGNFEAVVSLYDDLGKDVTLEPEDQVALLVSQYETGQYRLASQAAEHLLGDEVETPEILRYAALAAERGGRPDAARAHWQRLFYLGENQDEAGSAILSLMVREGHEAATRREWAEKVLEHNADHPDALEALWEIATDDEDVAGAIALLDRTKKLPDARTLSIAEACVSAGWVAIASRLVANSTRTPVTDEWVQTRAPEWLRHGLAMLEEGNLAQAAQFIQASWELGPRGNSTIRARRRLERALRIETRAAYAKKDFDRVLALATTAQASFTEYPEMDAFAGRAAYAAGDYRASLQHLARATDDISADIKLLQLLARAAVKCDRPDLALEAHKAILESTETSDKEVADSRKQVTGLSARLLTHARKLSNGGQFAKADALLEKAKFGGDLEGRIERERQANVRALAKYIQALENDDSDERFALGKLLLELDPTSEFGAKSAAIGAMRTHRFAEAIKYFQRMRPLTENTSQVDRNISKCKLFLKRVA